LCFHRPEPSTAGLVAQIAVAIGGADKDALPWLDHLLATEARAIPLLLASDERLEERRLDIACISAWAAKLAARVLTLTEASKMRRNETPGVSQAALKAAREKAGKTTSEVAQYLGLALEDYVAIEDTLPSDRFREAFAAIKPKLQKIGITVGDIPE
jgi:DNA-binding XRE family transcriptional regulator